jgi:hypothetical protein
MLVLILARDELGSPRKIDPQCRRPRNEPRAPTGPWATAQNGSSVWQPRGGCEQLLYGPKTGLRAAGGRLGRRHPDGHRRTSLRNPQRRLCPRRRSRPRRRSCRPRRHRTRMFTSRARRRSPIRDSSSTAKGSSRGFQSPAETRTLSGTVLPATPWTSSSPPSRDRRNGHLDARGQHRLRYSDHHHQQQHPDRG